MLLSASVIFCHRLRHDHTHRPQGAFSRGPGRFITPTQPSPIEGGACAAPSGYLHNPFKPWQKLCEYRSAFAGATGKRTAMPSPVFTGEKQALAPSLTSRDAREL